MQAAAAADEDMEEEEEEEDEDEEGEEEGQGEEDEDEDENSPKPKRVLCPSLQLSQSPRFARVPTLTIRPAARVSSQAAQLPTKRAAAAMVVNIGSFSDPPEAEGLAHFLEHMLFMGSEKYPDENEYDSYLTAHGGCCNAFTEASATPCSVLALGTGRLRDVTEVARASS
jgi:nardilysin